MEKRRCAACGEGFRACPRARDQTYCGKEECRRMRRRRWQRAKRQQDADYQDNQARAQRAWAGGHRSYWRAYRSEHPQYEQANRERTKQRQRDRRQRAAEKKKFAKMDSISPISPVPSGTYRLVSQNVAEFAKMDSILVKITVLSKE